MFPITFRRTKFQLVDTTGVPRSSSCQANVTLRARVTQKSLLETCVPGIAHHSIYDVAIDHSSSLLKAIFLAPTILGLTHLLARS